MRTEDWGLRTEDWGLRTEDWGLRTEERIKDLGLSTEDSLLPYKDGLTFTLWCLKNPHKLKKSSKQRPSFAQVVPACLYTTFQLILTACVQPDNVTVWHLYNLTHLTWNHSPTPHMILTLLISFRSCSCRSKLVMHQPLTVLSLYIYMRKEKCYIYIYFALGCLQASKISWSQFNNVASASGGIQ